MFYMDLKSGMCRCCIGSCVRPIWESTYPEVEDKKPTPPPKKRKNSLFPHCNYVTYKQHALHISYHAPSPTHPSKPRDILSSISAIYCCHILMRYIVFHVKMFHIYLYVENQPSYWPYILSAHKWFLVHFLFWCSHQKGQYIKYVALLWRLVFPPQKLRLVSKHGQRNDERR